MTTETRAELIDGLMESYCDWRQLCVNVRATYERFKVAPAADRAPAFAAYETALDQEQAAAGVYAEQVRRVEDAVSSATPPMPAAA
jgi:hypothetical protein